MKFIKALFYNIYSFLMDFKAAENHFGRTKALYNSLLVSSTLLTINILVAISYFVSWFNFFLFIWIAILLGQYFLFVYDNRFQKIFSSYKIDWIDRLIFPYIVLSIIAFIFLRKQN